MARYTILKMERMASAFSRRNFRRSLLKAGSQEYGQKVGRGLSDRQRQRGGASRGAVSEWKSYVCGAGSSRRLEMISSRKFNIQDWGTTNEGGGHTTRSTNSNRTIALLGEGRRFEREITLELLQPHNRVKNKSKQV